MEILEVDEYHDQDHNHSKLSSRRLNHGIKALWCFLISILVFVSLGLVQENDEGGTGFRTSMNGGDNDFFSSWIGMKNNKLPLQLVFHVGPAKMGSTSIQLGGIQKYYEELTTKDRYVVYNIKDASNLNHCLAHNMTQCMSQKGKDWTKFVQFMKRAKHNRRHVLISTENYWSHIISDSNENNESSSEEDTTMHADHTFLSAYSHLLVDELGYNVTIVFGYRPLYEYWTSWYYQTYRQFCGYGHEIVESRQIPTLANYLNHTNHTHGLVHPTTMGLHYFSTYFASNSKSNNFVIIPLGANLVSRFLCHAVVGATHACQAAIHANNQEQEQIHYNSGHTLIYDRIAQAARSQDVSQQPCKKLVQKLQTLGTAKNDTLEKISSSSESTTPLWAKVFSPLVCLSQEKQDWLLQKTIQYHEEISSSSSLSGNNIRIVSVMDNSVDNDNAVSLSSSFGTATPPPTISVQDLKVQFHHAANTTLCDVDTDLILQNWDTLWAKDNDNHTT